ncbi:MAG: molybdopterin molybdenumtransferase MoeA [Dehalococcoidia bacterium]|nr:molybdopterin molybdenumtransferase MoeA [Dehalococcoidia bacterium]
MISVEEALEKVLSYVSVLDGEEKPILHCLGQVLNEDVYSAIDVPPRDNSAMDGYAVKAEDVAGATPSSPVFLDVIGEVKAGDIPKEEVGALTALRIMTGAPIPRGADSVVQFEDTDEALRRERPPFQIGILHQITKGQNVRRASEDIALGQLVLKKGTVLRPAEVGVLASLGKETTRVIRRPVVAIIATGDELVALGQPLPEGKIYNSNSFSVAAQVLRYGGIPQVLGIARDRVKDIKDKIKEALSADLLLTSGGVSMGNYDLVKDVLAKQGEVSFWTVRMKPGKPLAFGMIKGVPHLGLPGNPVSSMITFELFARPAILKMMGKKNLSKPTIEAILDGHIKNTDGRRIFARAIVSREGDRYLARIVGPQGSGVLTSMSRANGLVIVPEDVEAVEEGETVKVLMLDWSEE